VTAPRTPAAAMPHAGSRLARLGRILQAVAAFAVLVALLGGLPWLLWTLAGWPLPRQIPTGDELAGTLTRPMDDRLLINTLACMAWASWTVFAVDAFMATATGIRDLRRHPAAGDDMLAGWGERRWGPGRLSAVLVGAILLAVSPPRSGHLDLAATTTAAAAERSQRPPAENPGHVAEQERSPGSASSSLAATAERQTTRHDYLRPDPGMRHLTVRQHDNLWCIAERELGDPRRWHEIHHLNRGRLQPDGRRLTDPDLIHPGWILRLPKTRSEPPSRTAGDEPPSGERASGEDRTPEDRADPGQQREMDGSNTPSPTTSVAPSTPPSPSPSTAPTRAAPTTSDQPAPAAETQQPPTIRPEDDGLQLPGSYLPWTLASAVTAAVALLWLQRRRRHRPGDLGDDPTDLPAPLLDIHRHVAGHPELPTHSDLAELAADVPTSQLLPPGGVGLVGDGAHAAARGLLVGALTSGGPRDPDAQAEVVIDGATLTTLIGADAAALGPWPRLHVTDDLDTALTVLDARLLHRSRILDEHALTDLDTLRAQAPDEEPLPPVLLITETPSPGAQSRARTTIALGAELNITAAILGAWPHGSTIHVTTDGHTRPVAEDDSEHASARPDRDSPTFPTRVAVLDTDTTIAILTAVREAHTGERATPPADLSPGDVERSSVQRSGPATAAPPKASETSVQAPPGDPERSETDPDATATPTVKADLRVLGGPPRVENATGPGKPLRAKAAELAAFLACHPDGADTRTIGEHLEPDVRLRNADVRVHTNVSNLRHVIGRAAGPRKSGHVIKTGGRYRLDPVSVDVDLWRLRDLLTQAGTAPTSDRIRLLREACDLYSGALADGCGYDWIEPHREKARQQITEAHAVLAEALVTDDPQAASRVLERAIRLDRYNEHLYTQAMQVRHRLGDRDGVRALLRALTVALADLDTEPDEGTIRLAHRLATPAKGPRP
jgi:DNA-binding SARP family transcriptional activator